MLSKAIVVISLVGFRVVNFCYSPIDGTNDKRSDVKTDSKERNIGTERERERVVIRAVVVAKLVGCLLPTTEIGGSNPVIGNFI